MIRLQIPIRYTQGHLIMAMRLFLRYKICYHCLSYYMNVVVLERSEKMKNEVTEKLELFLQNLRCEDTKRETLVHLDSCQEESERLAALEEGCRQVMNGLYQISRSVLEQYMEQMLSKSFAKQQEAYLQGMLDAFQILCNLGMLSTNNNVEKIIGR